MGYLRRKIINGLTRLVAVLLPAQQQYYRWLIRLNPRSADSHYHLGKLLAEQKNWQGAIDCYQQAINRNHPALSRVYYDLGTALSKLRRFK
ncbi:tetratricopeptide repeat protein, partial [Nostoc sp.]